MSQLKFDRTTFRDLSEPLLLLNDSVRNGYQLEQAQAVKFGNLRPETIPRIRRVQVLGIQEDGHDLGRLRDEILCKNLSKPCNHRLHYYPLNHLISISPNRSIQTEISPTGHQVRPRLYTLISPR